LPEIAPNFELVGSTPTLVTFLFANQSIPIFAQHSADRCRSNLFSIFDISRLVLKIFAVKVESCLKSGRIFDLLTLQNVVGAAPPPPQNCT